LDPVLYRKKTVGDTTTNPTPETPEFKDLVTTSKLTISNAQTSATGSYKCEADFSGTKIESTAAAVTVDGTYQDSLPLNVS
jgi:hypothetical protein